MAHSLWRCLRLVGGELLHLIFSHSPPLPLVFFFLLLFARAPSSATSPFFRRDKLHLFLAVAQRRPPVDAIKAPALRLRAEFYDSTLCIYKLGASRRCSTGDFLSVGVIKESLKKENNKKKVEVVVYFQLLQMSENRRADVNLPAVVPASLFPRADFVLKQYMGRRRSSETAEGTGWKLTCGFCRCSLKVDTATETATTTLTIWTSLRQAAEIRAFVSGDLLLPFSIYFNAAKKQRFLPEDEVRENRWVDTVPKDVNPGGDTYKKENKHITHVAMKYLLEEKKLCHETSQLLSYSDHITNDKIEKKKETKSVSCLSRAFGCCCIMSYK